MQKKIIVFITLYLYLSNLFLNFNLHFTMKQVTLQSQFNFNSDESTRFSRKIKT